MLSVCGSDVSLPRGVMQQCESSARTASTTEGKFLSRVIPSGRQRVRTRVEVGGGYTYIPGDWVKLQGSVRLQCVRCLNSGGQILGKARAA